MWPITFGQWSWETRAVELTLTKRKWIFRLGHKDWCVFRIVWSNIIKGPFFQNFLWPVHNFCIKTTNGCRVVCLHVVFCCCMLHVRYLNDQWECHTHTHTHTNAAFLSVIGYGYSADIWTHPTVLCLNNWRGLKILFESAIDGICLIAPLVLMGGGIQITQQKTKSAPVDFIADIFRILYFKEQPSASQEALRIV